MALTAQQVRGLRAPGKYRDGHGLVLHVVGAGKRYWVHRYMRDGRERSMSLGSADVLSLADARRLHAEARALLAKGSDPLDARAKAKAKRLATVSFGEAAERYIADHHAGWRGCGERHWRGTLAAHVLPHIGSRPVGDIDVEDVLRCLRPIWVTKNPMAVIVRSRLELVLDYARARGWVSGPNVATWRGNLRSLLPAPAKVHTVRHHPALPWRQAPALMASLAAEPHVAAQALMFLMLTATRSLEARGCRWSELDLDGGVWILPGTRMKGRRPHRVPLADPALHILAALAETRHGDLVFAGKVRGVPVCDVTLAQLLDRLGYADVTLHGFRSTFRDWCADHGKSFELAEAALAHVAGNAVVQAYQRSDLLEARRGLMQQWAAFLTRPPAAVIPIIRAAG